MDKLNEHGLLDIVKTCTGACHSRFELELATEERYIWGRMSVLMTSLLVSLH